MLERVPVCGVAENVTPPRRRASPSGAAVGGHQTPRVAGRRPCAPGPRGGVLGTREWGTDTSRPVRPTQGPTDTALTLSALYSARNPVSQPTPPHPASPVACLRDFDRLALSAVARPCVSRRPKPTPDRASLLCRSEPRRDRRSRIVRDRTGWRHPESSWCPDQCRSRHDGECVTREQSAGAVP